VLQDRPVTPEHVAVEGIETISGTTEVSWKQAFDVLDAVNAVSDSQNADTTSLTV